jgi:hypothetical protein
MNTLTARYAQRVEGQIRGVDWASALASRVELGVRCGSGVESFIVERDDGRTGFQKPVLHEEFYPKRGALITMHDYTARSGQKFVYRATFFGAGGEPIGVPLVVSVSTHWKDRFQDYLSTLNESYAHQIEAVSVLEAEWESSNVCTCNRQGRCIVCQVLGHKPKEGPDAE